MTLLYLLSTKTILFNTIFKQLILCNTIIENTIIFQMYNNFKIFALFRFIIIGLNTVIVNIIFVNGVDIRSKDYKLLLLLLLLYHLKIFCSIDI